MYFTCGIHILYLQPCQGYGRIYRMLKDFLKDRFIPHERNDFRPDFLERTSMGIMLVLVLLTFVITNIQAILWINSDWMVSTILPAVIVELTNTERVDGALSTLTRSDVLDSAAKLKAEDMAKNAYFAHYSPSGISPWFWFDKVSYNFIHAGENLAVHFTDSGDVVDAWMDSPTHRANIMNGNFTEIGVGTAKGQFDGESTIFVVQLFGTPSAVMNTPVAVAKAPVVAQNSAVPEILGETATQKENTAREENVTLFAEENPVNETRSTSSSEVALIEQVISPTETVPEEVVPTKIESPDGTKVMYSDLATTSREGIPATVNSQGTGNSGTEVGSLAKSATQPSVWLQIIYGILSLIVVLALLLSIMIEWRRQNPIQIAYAGGLLAVMALLIYVHTILTGGVLIV